MSATRATPVAAATANENGRATLAAATEPILVLNCGPSSIKFAAPALPISRRFTWSGKVDGSGAYGLCLVVPTNEEWTAAHGRRLLLGTAPAVQRIAVA
jgi:acetate kinase